MEKGSKFMRTLGMALLGCILLTTSVEAGTLKGLNQNDTTLVPMRVISEELGAKVDFDGPSKTITVSHKDSVILVKIGSKTATVNGVKEEVRVAPQIVDSITYVPFRFIGEALGGVVDYKKGSLKITLGDEEKQWDLETTVHQVENPYYAELMKNHRTAINEEWDYYQIEELGLGPIQTSGYISDDYGYVFMDINKDGIPELITGVNIQHLGGELGIIDGIYVLVDQKPIRIFVSAARGNADVHQDGTLSTSYGSGGVWDTEFNDLNADGSLKLKAGYRDDMPAGKITNTVKSNKLMSEEEARAMEEQYGGKINISFTPFVSK